MFRAAFEKDSWSGTTTYSIGYSVSDSSGLQSSKITKNDEIQTQKRWDGTSHGSVSREFETGLKETILDGLTGTTVVVRASDRHDNTREQVAMKRSNVYGAMAEEIAAETGASDTEAARFAGAASGITVGGGETGRVVNAIVEDPLAFIDAVYQIIEIADELGLISKVLETLPDRLLASLEEKQEQNNPYDPNEQPEAYDSFRNSWYAGYAVF